MTDIYICDIINFVRNKCRLNADCHSNGPSSVSYHLHNSWNAYALEDGWAENKILSFGTTSCLSRHQSRTTKNNEERTYSQPRLFSLQYLAVRFLIPEKPGHWFIAENAFPVSNWYTQEHRHRTCNESTTSFSVPRTHLPATKPISLWLDRSQLQVFQSSVSRDAIERKLLVNDA